jgi:DNA-binding MarR family transcriptional regulator
VADRWLTADEQRAWRAYLRAGSRLTAQLNRLLQADCGLSLPEYEVLVQLSEAPRGTLRPFQLGVALDWEQSRLSHMLSRMGRRGFVDQMDSEQAAVFGQVFEAILAGLENSGPQ